MTNVYDLFTGKTLTLGEIESKKGYFIPANDHDKPKDTLDILAEHGIKAHKFVGAVKPKAVKKPKVCEFTLQVKKNRYVKANCYLDMETLEARSYQWWAFVKKIQGKVVFNNYRYSATTAKHQRQMRILLDHLNIKIDMVVTLPKGLQDFDKLKELKAFEVKKQA